jgi:hypothetical protein
MCVCGGAPCFYRRCLGVEECDRLQITSYFARKKRYRPTSLFVFPRLVLSFVVGDRCDRICFRRFRKFSLLRHQENDCAATRKHTKLRPLTSGPKLGTKRGLAPSKALYAISSASSSTRRLTNSSFFSSYLLTFPNTPFATFLENPRRLEISPHAFHNRQLWHQTLQMSIWTVSFPAHFRLRNGAQIAPGNRKGTRTPNLS